MIVEVNQRFVYGVKRFYPMNRNSEALCKILNQKTLSEEHLHICRHAGWTVNISQDNIKANPND